ncbi:MAG: UDP-N-acetylmuramoyl-L-alanine--D-glutamate ligase [Opitutales bacterium]|nr:UDP-N-acetylmuramoyl-L-alanine--D-glutamate ligase [Opitutales bacterium]
MNDILKNRDELRQNYVAILGAGISGNGASALAKQLGWDYRIYDEQGRAFTYEEARECSIVVCSPGFKKDHKWRRIADECDKKVITEIDFAARYTNSNIIAITGTNGKTTLATFLTHLWNSINRPAVCGGNIGVPFSQLVADGIDEETTVFLETSSFQSEDLEFIKPKATLWTNFDEDHIDYHSTRENYFFAKAKLLEQTGDGLAIVGSTVSNFAQKIHYNLPQQCDVVNRSEVEQINFDSEHFLSTYPQQENMALAYSFARKQNVNDELFHSAVRSYTPEPHRLQKIGRVGKATFWNDSKATNFASALAACKNFKGNLFWIGGGRSKGGIMSEFAKKIRPLVQHAFLIGESGKPLSNLFSKDGFSSVLCNSLEEAVGKAFSAVTQKTNILLSPGFASFDDFENYEHRGNCFKKFVLDLKNITSMTTHERLA